MPHTQDNHIVAVGDVLYLPCRVKNVHAGVEYCNVDVETVYPMPPYDTPTTFSAINTRQFVKAVELDATIEELEPRTAPQSETSYMDVFKGLR